MGVLACRGQGARATSREDHIHNARVTRIARVSQGKMGRAWRAGHTVCECVCGCVCGMRCGWCHTEFPNNQINSAACAQSGGGAKARETHTQSGGDKSGPLATHSSVRRPASQLAHARATHTLCAVRAHQRAQGGVLINWLFLLGDLDPGDPGVKRSAPAARAPRLT